MKHRIHSRNPFGPFEEIFEGDVLFWKDGEDNDDGDTSGDSGGGSSQRDDDNADDGDDDTSGADDDIKSGDDEVAKARKRMRAADRTATDAIKRAKQAEDELAKLRKSQSDSGKGNDDNVTKLEQERADAQARADKAEAKLAKRERENMVTSVAASLKFKDLDHILWMVETGRVNGIDEDDLDDLERADISVALKALARSKPDLVGESSTEGDESRRGRGTNGQRKDRLGEEIEKLPQSQRAHARLMSAFSQKK